jgi:hypothetical protein
VLLTGYALLILLMWLIVSSLLPVLIGQVRQIVNSVIRPKGRRAAHIGANLEKRSTG